MLRIELLSKLTSQPTQSKILCHIAHLHLLLSEYTEGKEREGRKKGERQRGERAISVFGC